MRDGKSISCRNMSRIAHILRVYFHVITDRARWGVVIAFRPYTIEHKGGRVATL